MAEPAQPADLKSQAVRGVVASAGTQGGRLVVQLASLAVLSRLLDPEDFGLVAVVMAIIGVGELIRDMGLSSAAIQRPELPRGLASNLFWMNAGMGAVAMLAAAASGPLIAAAFGDERLATVALWLAPTFLLSGLTAQHRVSLVRDLRFATLGVVELAGQALGLVAAIALAVADLGYVALIGQDTWPGRSRYSQCGPSRDGSRHSPGEAGVQGRCCVSPARCWGARSLPMSQSMQTPSSWASSWVPPRLGYTTGALNWSGRRCDNSCARLEPCFFR